MRYFLIFLLLITAQLSFGQSVDSVSKIILQYGKGHNSWEENGAYDNQERIEISKNKRGNFRISEYRKIERRRAKGDYFADTAFVSVKSYPVISKSQIEKLFIALNTSRDNFSTAFVIPYLSRPDAGQILKAAHEIDNYAMFTDSNSDKEDRIKWFNEMQRFKGLDSFMNKKKPNPDLLVVSVSDAWDYMRLSCISGKDTIRFDMQFIGQLAGQPMEKFKKHSYDTDKNIVNLEINTIISALLPKGTLLRKRISLESLKEEYLEWYIKNELHF